MSDVFVSYKRDDRARVKPLVDALAAEGLSVWWDVGIEGGSAWRQSIQKALDAARCVVVVWSASSVGPGGEFVHDEAGIAKSRGIYLPVVIDDVIPPLGFGQVQALSLVGWRGRRIDHRFQELMRAAAAIVASAPGENSAPRPSAARRPIVWRPWAVGMLGMLILIPVAWFAIDHLRSRSPPKRIAVLPFETAGDDAGARTFAAGAADAVAGAIAKANLPTVFLQADPHITGPQRDAGVAAAGAGYALGGRVERDANDLDVTVNIHDPLDHEILWSKKFSRPAAEAPAMQEQVAAMTARVLKCAFDIIDSPASRFDHETVGLYLRACDLPPDWESQDQVRDLLRQVVKRQPRFAIGWARLAVADVSVELPPDENAASYRDARKAAQRALQLDPRDGTPFIALHDMVPGPGHLWERQSLLLKGLSLSPDNAGLNVREAELLGEAGRFGEALAYGRRAASLDPLDPIMAFEFSDFLVYNGRLTEARSVIDKAARLWPDDEYVRANRIATEARYGDPDRALTLIADPSSRPASWEASNVDEWRRFIDTRKSRDPAKLARYARDELASLAAGKAELGMVVLRLSSLGAIDATFDAASRSTPAKPLDTGVLFRPPADGVRRDPRFMPLMEKVGLVAFWRRTGKWADFCEAPDRPYDCRAVAAKLESAGAPRT